MIYVDEIPEDRRLHKTYHDRIVNGVPARLLKTEKVVWKNGRDRIIVVTALSPKWERVRVANVCRAANLEMHYDFGIFNEYEPIDERDIHLFIYCSGFRAIGITILEKRTGVCYYSWEEYDNRVQKTLIEQEAIWSLGFTWIHKKHSLRGIAKILLTEALSYLDVKLDKIGIYTPLSSDGEAFIRSISRNGFMIAK